MIHRLIVGLIVSVVVLVGFQILEAFKNKLGFLFSVNRNYLLGFIHLSLCLAHLIFCPGKWSGLTYKESEFFPIIQVEVVGIVTEICHFPDIFQSVFVTDQEKKGTHIWVWSSLVTPSSLITWHFDLLHLMLSVSHFLSFFFPLVFQHRFSCVTVVAVLELTL